MSIGDWCIGPGLLQTLRGSSLLLLKEYGALIFQRGSTPPPSWGWGWWFSHRILGRFENFPAAMSGLWFRADLLVTLFSVARNYPFALSWERLICAETLIWTISSFSPLRQINPLLGDVVKISKLMHIYKFAHFYFLKKEACEFLRASP